MDLVCGVVESSATSNAAEPALSLARRKRAFLLIAADAAGGAERITSTLARTLVERGNWDVDLYVMCAEQAPSFFRSAVPAGVRLQFGPHGRERFAFPFVALRLIGKRYDLAFSTLSHTNALLSLLRRLGILRCKRLVTRESIATFDTYQGSLRLLLRGLYWLYGAQDAVVAQTRDMAEHTAPFLNRRLRPSLLVAPNPIDGEGVVRRAAEPLPAKIAAALEGRENLLLFGRLIDRKAPLAALDVFAACRRTLNRPDQLVVVGDGPLRRAMETRAAELGLAGRVLFLGNQLNPFPIVARCQYAVVTSRAEGFPNIVLEMMACGVRKIVTTPCAGDLDALTGVSVTRSWSSDELAEVLIRAIADREDRRRDYGEVLQRHTTEAFANAIVASHDG